MNWDPAVNNKRIMKSYRSECLPSFFASRRVSSASHSLQSLGSWPSIPKLRASERRLRSALGNAGCFPVCSLGSQCPIVPVGAGLPLSDWLVIVRLAVHFHSSIAREAVVSSKGVSGHRLPKSFSCLVSWVWALRLVSPSLSHLTSLLMYKSTLSVHAGKGRKAPSRLFGLF